VKKVGLGLLVWMVLSVPVGILVGKVLKASREAMEREAPLAPPEPPEWVNGVRRVRPEPKAYQESPEHRAYRESQERQVRPDP
jgi:hypothetical protein